MGWFHAGGYRRFPRACQRPEKAGPKGRFRLVKHGGERHFPAMTRLFGISLLGAGLGVFAGAAAELPGLGVYATAGGVLRYLAPREQRTVTLERLRRLPVSRVFLEGRRGDEYVPPATLLEARDFLERHGIRCTGGIATVPGRKFGVRQEGGLGWLNWEAPKTRRDVANFFRENAPLFDTLIVDDFYCTGDRSARSEAARAGRPWGDYRRDLLVSLIGPLMREPAEAARPGVRLILKYPQWYDRFERFGYDPQRMSPWFNEIWVGTEVRNPATRRMGFVQPTEGYMNFRWLSSVAGDKVRGAWFDHIECAAEHFVDQAFQSVLAGARELTLFHLGNVVAEHPGDALLARRWPELRELAGRVAGRARRGIVFYKPVNHHGDENLYLADYLGMLGLPVLPEARWPDGARVVFLGAQAAGDLAVLDCARGLLEQGGTLICTPAFLRAVAPKAAARAGVTVSPTAEPAAAAKLRRGDQTLALTVPVDVDAGLRVTTGRLRAVAMVAGKPVPWLVEQPVGAGRVWVWNVRTFSDADFRATGEWLLAPRALGLPVLPQPVADALRAAFLQPLDVRLEAPSGVALYLFAEGRCLYNFRDEPVSVRLDGEELELPAKGWRWR